MVRSLWAINSFNVSVGTCWKGWCKHWVNSELLTPGGASRSYLRGRLGISSQPAAFWLRTGAANGLHRTEVWFSLTNCDSFPSASWLMPDWSLDHFYTQELSKNTARNKNKICQLSPTRIGNYFTEISRVSGYGPLSLTTTIVVTVLSLK